MTRYAQLTESVGNSVLETAKPFEDFAVGLVGVLARTAGRLPSPSFATIPVLVAEQVAAYSNLLSAQRDALTHLHAVSSSSLVAGPRVAAPKEVRVQRPATRSTAIAKTGPSR